MLAALLCASSALLPTSPLATPLLRAAPVAHRSAVAAVKLSLQDEKIESAKACAIAAVAGTVVAVPCLTGEYHGAEFGFALGMVAAELALFGAVYRCVVRSDDNKRLREGIIGAFALVRTFAAMTVVDEWTAKTSAELFGQGAIGVWIFGWASLALEYAFKNRYLYPLEGQSRDLIDYDRFYGGGYGGGGYGGGGYGGGYERGGYERGGYGGGNDRGYNERGGYGGGGGYERGGYERGGYGGGSGYGGGGGYGGDRGYSGRVEPTGGYGGPRDPSGGGSSYEEYMRSRR